MTNNQFVYTLTDERLANFIAGVLLFVCLNLFEEAQKQKHFCPIYCETKHKHSLVLREEDYEPILP